MEILATLILVGGVIDDLRSRKVHNYLILFSLVFTLIALLIFSGISGLITGSQSCLLAFGFGFPLYLARVVGAGDVKLFTVFGLATDFQSVLHVAVFSLLWGALLGVARAVLDGQFRKLILSTTQLRWTKGPGEERFRIPFTVALLFGWMTYISMSHAGVFLW